MTKGYIASRNLPVEIIRFHTIYMTTLVTFESVIHLNFRKISRHVVSEIHSFENEIVYVNYVNHLYTSFWKA